MILSGPRPATKMHVELATDICPMIGVQTSDQLSPMGRSTKPGPQSVEEETRVEAT